MIRRVLIKPLLLILILVVISAICAGVIITGKSQTPYDYLKKNNNDDVTAPTELLYQETSDTGLSVVFYIDNRGRYECAMIQDALLGYKTVGISGSLGVDNTDTYLYSAFVDGSEKHNICWGILTDDNVTEVLLDNEPCAVADTPYAGFRVYWLTDISGDNPSLEKK